MGLIRLDEVVGVCSGAGAERATGIGGIVDAGGAGRADGDEPVGIAALIALETLTGRDVAAEFGREARRVVRAAGSADRAAISDRADAPALAGKGSARRVDAGRELAPLSDPAVRVGAARDAGARFTVGGFGFAAVEPAEAVDARRGLDAGVALITDPTERARLTAPAGLTDAGQDVADGRRCEAAAAGITEAGVRLAGAVAAGKRRWAGCVRATYRQARLTNRQRAAEEALFAVRFRRAAATAPRARLTHPVVEVAPLIQVAGRSRAAVAARARRDASTKAAAVAGWAGIRPVGRARGGAKATTEQHRALRAGPKAGADGVVVAGGAEARPEIRHPTVDGVGQVRAGVGHG